MKGKGEYRANSDLNRYNYVSRKVFDRHLATVDRKMARLAKRFRELQDLVLSIRGHVPSEEE